jgi:hypothetical protein
MALAQQKERGFAERVFNLNTELLFMGKCTRTVGERRLGRTIYKLGNSVELSSKEGKAKIAEQNLKQKTQATEGVEPDSPVENLRDPSKWKKKQPEH